MRQRRHKTVPTVLECMANLAERSPSRYLVFCRRWKRSIKKLQNGQVPRDVGRMFGHLLDTLNEP